MGRHRYRNQLAVSKRPARWPLVVLLACVLLAGAAVTSDPLGGEKARPVGEKLEGRADDASDDSSIAGQALRAADVTTTRSPRSVSDEAARVLADLHDQGDCVLVRAGYLDLSGRVWGCVAQGAGWSEVRVVSSSESGSSVIVLRMDAQDVRAELGAN